MTLTSLRANVTTLLVGVIRGAGQRDARPGPSGAGSPVASFGPKSAKAPAFGEVVQLSCFTLSRQKGSDQAEPGRDRRETVGASFFSVAWQTVGELQERSECDAMTLSLHPPRPITIPPHLKLSLSRTAALRAPSLGPSRPFAQSIWRNTHVVDQRRSDCFGDCPLLGRRTLPIRCAGAAVHSDRPRRYPCG